MGDAAAEGSAAADDLVKKVATTLSKKYGLTEKVKGPLIFDWWFSDANSFCFNYHALSEAAAGTVEEEEGQRETRRSENRRRQENEVQRFAEHWLFKGRQEAIATLGREDEDFLEEQRKRCAKVEEEVDFSQIWYEKPSTYPDSLLTIAMPFAVKYLLGSVPPHQLRSARFRSSVFQGPDVFIPDHLSIHISAGLKFMLYKKPQPSLLKNAYADFERRFKWNWYFETEGTGKSEPYDPDYDLKEASDTEPPQPPAYIRNGLEAGRSLIDAFSSQYELPSMAKHRNSRLVWLAELKGFLDEHDYVITLTDKNLGAAVVKRTWLKAGARKLLSDTHNYRKVDEARVDTAVDKIRHLIEKLTDTRLENNWLLSEEDPQLAKFLRSKLPESDLDLPEFPEFYVIPKIHKNPTGYRPIVPCYNNITEPASKVVSKMLKPLYEHYPTILKGTKDLAQRISNIKLSRHRKVFIVTGDIVAYYPNIPVDLAVPIVLKLFMKFATEHSYTTQQKHIFISCLQIAVRSPLFMKFDNEFYEQIRGVPMGAACSPDIANLYGAYFESLFSEDPHIPFFGRFIDDCLAIVYADSAEQALSLLAERVKYDDCSLTWEASEWQAPFLDMLLYIDPVTNQVNHKPYKKPLNHLERIPWASHHPLDVKRGTFIGELSRLATLSSKLFHYLDAIKELKLLYLCRGYPVNLIDRWSKDHAEKRWQNRLEETVQDAGNLFVLKSSFNPLWEDFDVKSLFATIRKSWVENLPSIVRCNLEGRCALHNSATMQHTIPPNLLAAEKKRLDASEFKYSLLQNVSSLTDIQTPGASGSSETLHQETLDRFWTDQPSGSRTSRKRRQPSPDLVRQVKRKGDKSSASVTYETIVVPPPSSEPSKVPDTNLSVSCRSTDSTLPRLPEPDGPFSWAVRWKHSERHGLMLERTKVFDFFKTSFFNRRMLVSRKRTTNLFDLASVWRKAANTVMDSA